MRLKHRVLTNFLTHRPSRLYAPLARTSFFLSKQNIHFSNFNNIYILYIYIIYEIRTFLKLTQETMAGKVLIKNMPKHLYARPLPQYLTQPTSSFGLF